MHKMSCACRNYYRCTTTSCTVKKRMERSIQDTSIVVKTNEGTHTHHCPVQRRIQNFISALGTVTPKGYVGVQTVTTNYDGVIGGGDSRGRTCYGDSSSLFSTNNSLQERRFRSSFSSLNEDYGLIQAMMPL
ncbi:hypothetical protein T459_15180 [Capsicum annuum]|uniref:WRKY domain-containing protein n=1 Tax=Capsicum annuum TaxID=4072 RepID=A0A2G2ZJR7_CAPAN|nr:putative prefoldin subunit 3-like [Capsicum annuum]PHT82165.1 hypothetical protein T459_15180 [Capsicum annuum]